MKRGAALAGLALVAAACGGGTSNIAWRDPQARRHIAVVASPEVPRSPENIADENRAWATKNASVPTPAPKPTSAAQVTPDAASFTAGASDTEQTAPSSKSPDESPTVAVAVPTPRAPAPTPAPYVAEVAGAQSNYVAPYAPPPPRIDPAPLPPSNSSVWIDGDWYWDGYRYVWVSGRWVGGAPGYVYVRPRWVARNGAWMWLAGGWGTSAGVVLRPFPYGSGYAYTGGTWNNGYWNNYGYGYGTPWYGSRDWNRPTPRPYPGHRSAPSYRSSHKGSFRSSPGNAHRPARAPSMGRSRGPSTVRPAPSVGRGGGAFRSSHRR
ncbi:MAG: hypothetical protein R3A78_13965 [Polyangiales bacterium]